MLKINGLFDVKEYLHKFELVDIERNIKRGKLMITQKVRWAGPHILPNLELSTLADDSGLLLIGNKKWQVEDFPEYIHVLSNPGGGTTSITPAVTYIYVKNE